MYASYRDYLKGEEKGFSLLGSTVFAALFNLEYKDYPEWSRGNLQDIYNWLGGTVGKIFFGLVFMSPEDQWSLAQSALVMKARKDCTETCANKAGKK